MKTEKKLLELEKEIYQINRIYKELVNELQKEETEQEIDFERIVLFSKSTAFFNHYITGLDEEQAYRFCRHLAGAIALLQDKEEKIRQYYFVARIAAAAEAEISFDDLVRDSRLISTADLEILGKALSQEGKLTFLINLLLMISFYGSIDDAQLDYFCEVASFFAIGRDILENVFLTVRGILTGQDQFYDYADSMPLNAVSCFLQNNPYDHIVNRKAEIGTCQGAKIIVCGVHFKNQDLMIDHYKKKHITFRNCSFEKISGITSMKTAVEFVGCKFIQCYEKKAESGDTAADARRTKLFSFRTAKIQDCCFEDCELTNKKGLSVLLHMERGELCSSVFKHCKISDEGIDIRGENRWNCATIVRGGKVLIKDCQFVSCSAYSNNHYFLRHLFTDHQCMHIVTNSKGTVENCRFENCKCIESNSTSLNSADRYYYVLNNIHGVEMNNVFERCDAVQEIGSVDWE